jgi:hypothetical protein
MRRGFVLATAAVLISLAAIVSSKPLRADEPASQRPLCSEEDRPTIEEIFSAWRARSGRVRNFRAEWHHVTLPGKQGELAVDVALPPAGPFPTERLVLSMDSNRVAFRRYPLGPAVESEEPDPSIVAFDGVNKHSLVRSYSEMMPTTIRMSPGTWMEAVNNSEYFPFVATFRFLDVQGGWGFEKCQCRIEERETMHEGQPCILLRFECGRRASLLVWVSRDAERRILRAISKTMAHNGRHVTNWDIDLMDFRNHPIAGPVPHRWRKYIAEFTRPHFPHHEAVLQRFDINVDFPDQEFSVEPFPVGAIIHDDRDSAKGTQRSQVMGNGRLRSLPGTQSPAHDPDRRPPVQSESGATIAFGVLVLVVIAGFVWRTFG